MMIKLIGFEPSNYKNKKYNAILKINNPDTGLEVTQKVPFGDRRYQHYYDKIGLYPELNHLDKKRKKLFKQRHENTRHIKYSPSWFADTFLWG